MPASSEISLFSTIKQTISQTTLDAQMHTNNATSGTSAENALSVLNAYANPKGYAYYLAEDTTVAQQNEVLNYDIGDLRVAPIALIFTGMLPRGDQQPDGSHAIAVVGFQPSVGMVEIEDPINGQEHTLSSQQLFVAEQSPKHHPEQHELMVIGKVANSTPTS